MAINITNNINKATLIKQGVVVLNDAEAAANGTASGAEQAKAYAEIASAYARLAEAIGDSTVYRY